VEAEDIYDRYHPTLTAVGVGCGARLPGGDEGDHGAEEQRRADAHAVGGADRP
jgi:hypothetical protein